MASTGTGRDETEGLERGTRKLLGVTDMTAILIVPTLIECTHQNIKLHILNGYSVLHVNHMSTKLFVNYSTHGGEACTLLVATSPGVVLEEHLAVFNSTPRYILHRNLYQMHHQVSSETFLKMASKWKTE